VQAALQPGVFERLAGEPLDPRTTHVFLCGNPAMVTEVGAWLEERGFTGPSRRRPGTLHTERYW
jgi:ferredoxin--NADP+ reductase